MENLPKTAITIILSFSNVEDVVQYACVARAWASCVEAEPIATKVVQEKPLAIARRMGNEVAVELLSTGLEAKYYKCDNYDWMGYTPLHIGAYHGHIHLVHALLERGVFVEPTDDYDDTPLHVAARHGYCTIIKALISNGANVDPRDEINRTPLMLAAIFGHPDASMALIAEGSDLDARDDGDNTALILAASEGWRPVVQALICAGANLKLKNAAGKTALQCMLENGHIETASILEQASNLSVNTLSSHIVQQIQ